MTPASLKALCLYLNSTPGLLALLGERDNRAPSYPSFSLDTLRSVPVPDFTTMVDADLQLLTDCFERLQLETLQPFPLMADDPVRAQIDDAISRALKSGRRMDGHHTPRVGPGAVGHRSAPPVKRVLLPRDYDSMETSCRSNVRSLPARG